MSKKVLIAEDSSVIQNLTKKILKMQNYEIVSAKNGLEVLSFLDSDNFDIILMDFNMPKMNGIEFLHEIRNDTALKNAVVYVLTTSESPNDIDEVRQYNVSGYIVKPLERVELLKALSILDAYWSINQILN